MAEEAELIGGRIRELRIERGMKQRELADALPGRTESKDISRWENGHHRPTSDTLSAIANALDTTVADLLAGPVAGRQAPAGSPLDALSPGANGRREAGGELERKVDAILAGQAQLLAEVAKVQAALQVQRGSQRRPSRRSAGSGS